MTSSIRLVVGLKMVVSPALLHTHPYTTPGLIVVNYSRLVPMLASFGRRMHFWWLVEGWMEQKAARSACLMAIKSSANIKTQLNLTVCH